jgi:hypothetical protein
LFCLLRRLLLGHLRRFTLLFAVVHTAGQTIVRTWTAWQQAHTAHTHKNKQP